MPQTTEAQPAAPGLVRGLRTRDAALITVGSVLGTGIFITTSDIARLLPHPGLILAVWMLGGVLTLAGALTYAELGAMFPKAGGQYHFLKEAYGPVWGFLFGWAAFTVINSGGIAALAVGFGEYLGSFVPFFSTGNVLWAVVLGGWTWSVSGGQVAGMLAILLLTAVNYIGLKEGTIVQNVVTIVKIGSIVGLAVVGLMVPPVVSQQLGAPIPPAATLTGFGLAMVAVLWSFDGWYGATASAGEMADPKRSLPLGLVIGTLVITALYGLMNLVYIRAVPVELMPETARIGETAASALFGPTGARFVSMAVLVSTFGCISSTILWAPRIYLAMAEDRLFFASLARVHPRHRTPGAAIVTQGVWAAALTLSGTYEQLYTYVIFAGMAFHVATGMAVIVLRSTRPDAPRPYRAWGYPLVPMLFVVSSLAIVLNTLWGRPYESIAGLGLVALGLPAYFWWKRQGLVSREAPPCRPGGKPLSRS
jgi:basic amino acid/polyamine antiporter, APA family